MSRFMLGSRSVYRAPRYMAVLVAWSLGTQMPHLRYRSWKSAKTRSGLVFVCQRPEYLCAP
jgi:hypothetical protein